MSHAKSLHGRPIAFQNVGGQITDGTNFATKKMNSWFIFSSNVVLLLHNPDLEQDFRTAWDNYGGHVALGKQQLGKEVVGVGYISTPCAPRENHWRPYHAHLGRFEMSTTQGSFAINLTHIQLLWTRSKYGRFFRALRVRNIWVIMPRE
jgi:hypothetical protein